MSLSLFSPLSRHSHFSLLLVLVLVSLFSPPLLSHDRSSIFAGFDRVVVVGLKSDRLCMFVVVVEVGLLLVCDGCCLRHPV